MTESKKKVIDNFNPNNLGTRGNIYGLPFNEKTADLILIPVPWEVTVSYKAGTATGPQHILDASVQVDLFQKDIEDAWKLGVHMLPINGDLQSKSDENRALAVQYLALLEVGEEGTSEAVDLLQTINKSCGDMVGWVKNETTSRLKAGKLVGIVGGDHSTPLGAIQALAEKYDSFGILQIDAHMDLRKAYENFEYSHASIIYNALKVPQVENVVQVGIRDFCEEEMQFVRKSNDKVVVFFDDDIKNGTFEGESWNVIVDRIIKELPTNVYVSFDIDGLGPELCPNTGTPVPGGLSYSEAVYLLTKLVKNGKKIIGFDLNEVAPGENTDWNGNVGARLLYRIANLMGVSHGKLHWSDY
jgi:agmatinase